MQPSLCASLLVLTSVTSAYVPESTTGTDNLAAESLAKLTAAVLDGSLKEELASKDVPQTCTIENAAVRRE
jgi:tyrosinase